MTHLHVHSAHSIIDGRATIDDYVTLAEKDGQESLALTEHGSLGSVIEAYLACRKHGINFIAGQELYVDAGELGSPANKNQFGYGHLTVLAKNEAGYRALIAANNLAHRQFYQKPRITLQQIVDNKFAQDWVILSGCMSSPIFQQDYATAEQTVKVLAQNSANFFLEAMWHYSEDEQFNVKQNSYLERVAALHKSTGIPIALTNDCHYAYEHQENIHNELLRGSHSPSELEFDGQGFHFLTLKEMQAVADGLGCRDALDNSISIGEMCKLVIPEAENTNWYVPDITGGVPEKTIRELCEPILMEMENTHHNAKEYYDRYNYELSVLKTSPAILNSYLVTHDVVRWCTDRGFAVAARGSMAGSLVSHLLGITLEDPVKYNLSFSRACNPARPSIPDFDLDISSIHRQEVLDYLKERYAGNIPICSYTHYGPKGALRKILRMEGLRDQQNINDLCKPLPDDWPVEARMIWDPKLSHYTYPKGLSQDAKVVVEVGGSDEKHHASNRYHPKWLDQCPENYWDFLCLYEGLYSNLTIHPSGVLISGPERELEHEVPLQWIASSKTLASAFDMYTLKKIGLFKLDVLGLKTLDQLDYMERMSGEKVSNDNYDEPEVLAAFGADLLAEIFQMDGYACREVIRSIGGIKNFEDIIAANTLARPGASEFTKYYRSGYEGLIHEYPAIAEVLSITNGLILYQEQVMEIARVLADFDDAEQDDVKEAIKYFRHEIWEGTIAPLFNRRCEAKGIDATNILSAISKMASYTYNRAHAMTYAAIAYKMMWYKVHHPTVYYAATFDGSDDKPRLVLESHFFGVKWRPADVNKSEAYTTIKDGEILLGLAAIKGVGPAAVEALSKARPFSSLEDLEERVERRKCNSRVITALKEAFALTSLGEPGLYARFEECFSFPYKFLDSSTSRKLSDWQSEYSIGRLGGFVVSLKEITIQKAGLNQGKQMGRLKVGNINGTREAIMWPDHWKKARGVIYSGAAVRMEGSYQLDGTFIVDRGELYDDD